MQQWTIGITAIGIFLATLIIQGISRVNNPFKKTIFSMLTGIVALIGVNIAGNFTGVTIPVSLLSLGVSAAGSIPGVTLLVLMNTII